MCSSRTRHAGVTLVELIVSIVILGIGVAGILGAITFSARTSVDPMVQKQALAIAEAIMEEVQLQPFTYCDPDDPQAATALSAAVGPTGCSAAAAAESPGPEGVAPYGPETRLSLTTPFDNVNDYNGFTMNGATDLAGGTVIPELAGYTASVTVAGQALSGVPAGDSLLITVTVTRPGDTTVSLQGYRVRYAPNALP